MRVQKVRDDSWLRFLLLDGEGLEVTAVSDFLRHLRARGSSPNTLSAYAYDLLHLLLPLPRRRGHHLPRVQPASGARPPPVLA